MLLQIVLLSIKLHVYTLGRQLQMGFHEVASLPSQASSTPRFFKIVVMVKTSGPPHVLTLWLGVSKGMLPVRYVQFNKSSFCVSQTSLRSQGCYKDEVNLAMLNFGDFTRGNTLVSLCLLYTHTFY